MKKKHQIYRIFLLAAGACLLFCSHEYNPFSDFDNAAVSVDRSSLKNLDTVQIFSTESLEVVVTVKELVDSFRVSATANRLWARPESTITHDAFGNEPFSFLVSFHDTGWQSIVMTSYRTNNTRCEETLSVYLKSPLDQEPISVNALDSVTLRTPRVKDRDVTYFWAFGSAVRFISPTCSTTVAPVAPVISGTGTLWVWDGHVSSPKDSFPFMFRDTIGPAISCDNGSSYISNDTIYTSDSVFTFRARITDDFSVGVDSASVNGHAFDGKNGDVYYALFDRVYMHPAASPLSLSVYALDHFQSGTATEKTFRLAFSTAVPHMKKIDIVVLSPAHDSTVVTTPQFLCAGRVDNLTLDSLDLSLHASVNGVAEAGVRIIRGSALSWEWGFSLTQGEDTVRIIATDNSTGDVLDLKEFSLFYTPDAPDTVPPRILDITTDGRAAQGMYTGASTVIIRVRAFDEGSGIDTLLINGVPCTAAGFWYTDTIPLRHLPSGNEVTVTAVDRKKNAARQTVIIYRNNAPVIQKWPTSSFIVADSPYTDAIGAIDPDQDTLVFQRTEGPAGLAVSQGGAISWSPARTDTGAHAVTIRVWDGYQPVFATYTLYVSLPGQGVPKPVSFLTKAEDFPEFLVAGRDSLTEVLRVANGTGIPPFAFSCRIVGRKAALLENSRDSTVSWLPSLSDTGYRQFIVVVADRFPSTDTLYPRILIAPPQRPCSIAVAYHTVADTLVGGTLNLNSLDEPFRLVFRIFDPDNPLVERHTVTLFESRTHTTSSFDSAVVDTFGLTIDPTILSGYDTIVATVRDASSKDTIRVSLYYGSPPDAPAAIFPLNFSQINQASVALSFSCRDGDGDSLSYDVFAGKSPAALSRIATIADTSLTIFGLSPSTTYFWNVVAHDWKSQTISQLWQFTTGAF